MKIQENLVFMNAVTDQNQRDQIMYVWLNRKNDSNISANSQVYAVDVKNKKLYLNDGWLYYLDNDSGTRLDF